MPPGARGSATSARIIFHTCRRCFLSDRCRRKLGGYSWLVIWCTRRHDAFIVYFKTLTESSLLPSSCFFFFLFFFFFFFLLRAACVVVLCSLPRTRQAAHVRQSREVVQRRRGLLRRARV